MTKFKLFFPLSVVVFFASLLTSCGKADEIVEVISESDAVEIIEANFQADAGGLVTNIEDVAKQLVAAVTSGELCDTLYSETIQEDFQGSQIQASYTSELSYEMACNTFGIPQAATFSTLTSSIYNSSRIVSDDDGDFSGNATDLQPLSPTTNIDGDYSRTGTQELDFMQQKEVTSTLTVNLSTLRISKQGYEIESGSGTILLTGSTTAEPFSYQGDIVFNGGNTATITINGTTYQIDWN